MADADWKLERFYHTIINAKDIDESVRFYQDLGFVIVRDRRRMTWPPGGGVVFGLIPDVKGRGGTLMALPSDPPPDGPMLDIIQWLEPEARFNAISPTTVPRVTAFRTRNVQGALKAMQAKGWRTTTPEAYTGNAAAGITAVGGVYDPNGNVIELIELEEGLTTSRLQETYGTDAS
ncbi:MAG TPA: VOC family protein [Caulobacteraceae bacterium]|jgi:catechol 2,3-dioxygenase-like lactoylglutathione lyase family enzyme|nr:VOC family protein [Caulobacteraceae bacterium]